MLGVDPVDARGRPRCCVPGCPCARPSGREVYTIALTAQILIEPAKRPTTPRRASGCVELFGEPERWATPRAACDGPRATCWCRPSPGPPTFELPVPCNYDLELAATKYFHALADGEVPLAFHFNGTIFYAARTERHADRPGALGLPRPATGCRSRSGRDDAAPLPDGGLGPRWAARRSTRCAAQASARPAHLRRRASPSCCAEAGAEAVSGELERAGRVAALRGLRALSVHAGRDQERHADAVRDRLPARLRGRNPAAFDHLRWSACWRGRGASCRRDRALPAGRAASATGRASAARPAPSRGEAVGVRLRRRCAGRVRLRSRDPRATACRASRSACTTRPRLDDGRRRPRARRCCAPALDPRGARASRRAASSRRSSARRELREASTPCRCSPPPTTTPCSAPRSSCPTIPRSRPRAAATCSTTPRSRRRCCSTCRRSATPSARRSPSRIPRCGR